MGRTSRRKKSSKNKRPWRIISKVPDGWGYRDKILMTLSTKEKAEEKMKEIRKYGHKRMRIEKRKD